MTFACLIAGAALAVLSCLGIRGLVWLAGASQPRWPASSHASNAGMRAGRALRLRLPHLMVAIQSPPAARERTTR
ncbi:hypothetical protein ACBJ59_10470 [Nonomuraea sp. MTCD27]|uniref:hypothetical protein n=1 Tax=Nonomuraea sp. MTCD27 TaxID=1676747 RepID=UPI0035C04B53